MDKEKLRKKYFGWEYNQDKTKRIYRITEGIYIYLKDYQKRFRLKLSDFDTIKRRGKYVHLAKKPGRLTKEEIARFKSLPEGLGLREFEFYFWKYYRIIKSFLNETRFDKYSRMKIQYSYCNTQRIKDTLLTKDDLFQEAYLKLLNLYLLLIQGKKYRTTERILKRHFKGRPVCQYCRENNKPKVLELNPKTKDYICPICKCNWGSKPNSFSITYKTTGPQKETWQYYYFEKNQDKKTKIKDDPLFNTTLITTILKNYLIEDYIRKYEHRKAPKKNEKIIYEKPGSVENFKPKEEGPYKFDYKEVYIPKYLKKTIEEREPDLIIPAPSYADLDEIESIDGYTREEFVYHNRERHNYDSIGLESPYYTISEIAYIMRKFLKGYYNISQANICTKVDTDKMLVSIKNPVKRKCFILYCIYIVSAPKWRKRDNPGESCPDSEREGPVTIKIIAKHFGITQRAVNKNINYVIKYLGKHFGVVNDFKRKSKKLSKSGS